MTPTPKVRRKPKGAFVFIDDDPQEHFLLKSAMKALDLHNPVVSWMNGSEAFKYLKETKDEIFLIISDLNMPVMDGLELKRMIEITPELKVKAVPFVFHSNTGSPAEIRAAYASGIQGFLRKGSSLEETIVSLQIVVDMWADCIHPKDLNPQLKLKD